MKNLLIGLFLLLSVWVTAQTPVFTEDFEGTNISLTSQSTSAYNWATSTTYFSQGIKSDSCTYGINDTVYLVSDAFSTLGSQIVFLEFDQICKLELFDIAYVEVSDDNGTTWIRLTTQEYEGAGSFYSDRFNEASYGIDWGGGSPVTPLNSWWKSEKFNISGLVANKSQVKLRFAVADQNANGTAGRQGWFIDNVSVWKPSTQEAALIDYKLPYSMTSGCGLSNEKIEYTIYNNGANTINGNLTASFKREGQAVVTENVTATILAGDTFVYSFINNIDLSSSVDTNYQVQMWVTLPNDPISSNDSLVDTIASNVALASPVFSDTTITFASDVLLHATHPNEIKWFSDQMGNNKIGAGQYFQTPNLYDTTLYFVQSYIDQSVELTTTFSNTGSGRGNMFDIKAFNDLTIDSFYVNVATNALMEVWYYQGTYVGHTTSNAGWTKLGEYTMTDVVDGTPTLLPIGGLTIPAGQTYGICITYVTYGTTRYTSGTGNNDVYQDANMKLTCGSGGDYFAYNYSTRVWNGRVLYHVGEIVCPSVLAPLEVSVSGIPNIDAGLESISPLGSITLNDSLTVTVSLINKGVSTLTKCNLYYSINDSVMPVVAWTGSLLRNATELVNLGGYTFNSPIYDIKAWVELPNDSADQASHNDTIYGFANSCLSGEITLGGPFADIPDFATLQTIIAQVGICGNTTINILPGIYNEQIEFADYQGLGVNSQLIFQSSTGDPADVIIQYTANADNDNYVVKFNRASYITLRNVTINANDLSYATAVYLTDSSTYNTVDGNIIFSNSIASSSNVVNLDGGIACDYNTVSNNHISGGYYGINVEGTSIDTAISNGFYNNEVVDFWQQGINVNYNITPIVRGNKFRNTDNDRNIVAISFYRSKGCVADGNDINLIGGKSLYGIKVYYCDSTASVRGSIINNMIITKGGTLYHYGLYYKLSSGYDIINNSFYNTEGSSSSSVFYVYNKDADEAGQRIYNNNIFNAGLGKSIYVRKSTRLIGADNNNIYSTTTGDFAYWGTTCSNLAAIKAASSSQNQNSISVNPQFLSLTDLHSKSTDLDGAGAAFAGIVDHDFDGDTRDPSTPDIGADEYMLLGEDAGVTALVAPVYSCPGDSAAVIVKITSLGVDTLFSYTLNWKVNGVLQTPITYNDTLLFSQFSNQYIGKFPFAFGIDYQLEMWTSMPNGVVDLNSANDTLIASYKTSLAGGTYTIGGNNPDYVDFTEAATDLNNHGICGSVVFEVADGTYPENIELIDVYGVSSSNTITFQSVSGDSSAVILTSNGNSTLTNYVVRLENTSYVSFKNITLQSTSSTYSKVLVLASKPSHISIQNCVIKNTSQLTGSTSNNERNLIHSVDSIGDYFHLEHSKLINGNKAVLLNGGYAAKSDWEISNNEFVNNAAGSISLIMTKSCNIESNTITSALIDIENHKAISIDVGSDSINIVKNKFDLNANAACQALSITNSNGSLQKSILVANNFIRINQITGSDWSAAIDASASKNLSIYHNNISLSGSYTQTAALYVSNYTITDTENLNIKNNVFANYISGSYIYKFVNCDTASYSADYNALHNANGGFISGTINTLSDWQTANPEAMHSMIENPYYTSITDLHVLNNSLNGSALLLTNVADDIDGDIRDITNPDIGADEFIASPIDVKVQEIRNPISDCGLSSTENISILLKNVGSSDITGNLQVSYKLNANATPVQETINSTILAGDTLLYTFATTADMDVNSLGTDLVFNISAWAVLTGDVINYNDTAEAIVSSNYIPAAPTANNVVGTYGSSATLTTTSTYSIEWFATDTGMTPVGNSNTYQTPILYDTTQYWLTANTANCSSNRTMTQVNITNYPAIDAGISAVVSPDANVGYNTNQDFKVTLSNYGLNDLTSVWIYWDINNQIDSMFWTGTLAHSQDSIITVDNFSFTGGQYQFDSWTTNPNASVDNINSNDTSSHIFNVCLMGTYTIGDTLTGQFDFGSFTDAISELSAGGICGPVTFMADAGIYDEHLVFPPVNGASSDDRITFTSIGADSNLVKIHYSLSSAITSTIDIQGKYYTFSNMTISGINGNSFGRVIQLSNGAKYNKITNCILEGDNTTTANSSYAIVYNIDGSSDYNEFTQNLFLNGSYPVYFYASNGNKHLGTVIEDNIMLDYNYGSYLAYQKNLKFSGNFIESANGTTLYGLSLRNSEGFSITENKIEITASSNHKGMYFFNCIGSVSNRNLVANNFVTVNGVGSSAGYVISTNTSTFINIYNNSLRLIGGGGNAAGLYFVLGSEINVVNNVIVNNGSGYAYYVSTTSAIGVSDYNNIYNTNGDLGYYQGSKTSLSAFKAASGQDLNSISVDPLFFANADLHSLSGAMNNYGTPLSEVTTDIDGQNRSSLNPDMGADEFSIPDNDASIADLNSPTSPVSPGVNSVKVDLANFGALTLTSVTIAWEANGITQTPFSWTGSLANGSTESAVNIGNYTFGAGGTLLKIWTENPNNSSDTINYNDTIEETVISCNGPLSGSYTIGGTTSNYSTIGAAVSSLKYCGISASVVFNILPGTYNEQIHMEEIYGASASSTITFQSSTLDSSDVNIVNTSTNSGNYVWFMDGADWIRVKHIGMEATSPLTGRALVFAAEASNNIFESNIIKATLGSTNSSVAIYSADDEDNYNTFKYNSIQGGYYGVYLEGQSATTHEQGNVFEYNEIKDYLLYGVYLYYSDDVVFSHNKVEPSVGSSHSYGVTLKEVYGPSEVANNTIIANTPSASTGFSISSSEGSFSNPAHIYNNFVSITSTSGSSRGIILSGSKYQYLSNNNVYVSSTGNSSSALYASSGSSNRNINNCLSFNGNGYALYITHSASLSTSDNNNLYTNGNKLAYFEGVEAMDLATWLSVSNDDSNSVSTDPIYASTTDLHVSAVGLNAAASSLSWITTDYDGEARNANTPDIGADEFAPAPFDAGIVEIIDPNESFGSAGVIQTIKAVVRNLGSDTIFSVPVAYKYGSSPEVSQIISDTILPGDTLMVLFNLPITIVLGQADLCVYTLLAGDSYASNDTLCMNISGLPIITPSYCDDFEGQNLWASTSPMWQLGTPNGTVINAANSGSNAWTINLCTVYNNSGNEYLYTPYYDFSTAIDAELSFWRNNILESNDGFNVEYTLNGGLTWILLGTWGDPLGTNWYNGQSNGNHYFTSNSYGWSKSSYNLSLFNQTTNPIQFRFHFVSDGAGVNEGVAFDDFCIDMGTQAYDAGVVSIDSPIDSTQIGVTNNDVTITIINEGDSTLTSIPVNYQIDNNTVVSEVASFSPGLTTGSVSQYTFTQQFSSPTQDYLLCAYTSLTGDISTNNDKMCKTIYTKAANFDAGVTMIISPSDTVSGNQQVVTVRIKNYGALPLSSCDVQYMLSTSTSPTIETWTGTPLAQGDSVEFTFNQSYPSMVGQTTICAKTLLTNDIDPSNDQVCKSVYTTGLRDQSLPEGMNLWQNRPNPANGLTTISFEIPASGVINFQLINGLGQPIYQLEENKCNGKHSIEIDASKLSPGIYYYSLYYNGYRATKKLLVR